MNHPIKLVKQNSLTVEDASKVVLLNSKDQNDHSTKQNQISKEEPECLNLNAEEDNNCSDNDDFEDLETLEYQR